MSMSVLIPLKSVEKGKSRLAQVLTPIQRRDLCIWLLQRTLKTLSAFGKPVIVSEDPSTERLAKSLTQHVSFIHAPEATNLNEALSIARASLPSRQGLLIVPIDLVHLKVRDLRSFLSTPETITIAPDLAKTGTNLLYLPANTTGAFRFAYGTKSYIKHCSEAVRLGLKPSIYYSMATARDIDTVRELRAAVTTANFPLSDLVGLNLLSFRN